MNVLTEIAFFLIDTLFTLFIALFMIRMLLGLSRADFYNPFSQFIVTATNPLLKPLRRVVPPVGRIDTAAVVIMVALKLLQLTLLLVVQGKTPELMWLAGTTIVQLLSMLIYVYMFSIIIEAVLTWINPTAFYDRQNPLASILHSINTPLLHPLSRIVPRIGMIDITPLVAILILNILLIVIRAFG
ncbi:MAG: YggT family protein [Thiotrichales bacterium]